MMGEGQIPSILPHALSGQNSLSHHFSESLSLWESVLLVTYDILSSLMGLKSIHTFVDSLDFFVVRLGVTFSCGFLHPKRGFCTPSAFWVTPTASEAMYTDNNVSWVFSLPHSLGCVCCHLVSWHSLSPYSIPTLFGVYQFISSHLQLLSFLLHLHPWFYLQNITSSF